MRPWVILSAKRLHQRGGVPGQAVQDQAVARRWGVGCHRGIVWRWA